MLELLGDFHGKLKDSVYEDTRELIANREWGVALENLCQNLYEFDVEALPDSLAKIKKLSVKMQLPPKTSSFLDKDYSA